MAISVIKDVITTQNNLGNRDEITPVFELFSETLKTVPVTTRLTKQNIGHAFTVGHSLNGVVGTANGVDGSQVTIGVGGLGSSSVVRVVNEGAEFREYLRTTMFEDSTVTTATVDTSNFTVSF